MTDQTPAITMPVRVWDHEDGETEYEVASVDVDNDAIWVYVKRTPPDREALAAAYDRAIKEVAERLKMGTIPNPYRED